jgi:hypothetical protein
VRARAAERERWEYLHGRWWQDGTPDTNCASAAFGASKAERNLQDADALFTHYGVIDADEADALVAETRAATRAELDAKWLPAAEPRAFDEDDDEEPTHA